MDYIIIEVPDMNDSISAIVLGGKKYYIRFTYNDTFDYWMFSLYDNLNNEIVNNIKIVPSFPLNLFSSNDNLPSGFFAALTEADRVGRYDFVNEVAQFVFVPVS